jgi:hypothetical protein
MVLRLGGIVDERTIYSQHLRKTLKSFAKHLPSMDLRFAKLNFRWHRQQGSKKNTRRVSESNGTNLELLFLLRTLRVSSTKGGRVWIFLVDAVENVDT